MKPLPPARTSITAGLRGGTPGWLVRWREPIGQHRRRRVGVYTEGTARALASMWFVDPDDARVVRACLAYGCTLDEALRALWQLCDAEQR